MAHGNIYPPEKVDAALSKNYFKPVNLVALRELALLWVADEVDVALQRHRAEQHVTEVWDAPGAGGGRGHRRPGERDGVGGGPPGSPSGPGSGRGGADLLCVHVLRRRRAGRGAPGALATLRRLADDVGASFHTVVGGERVPAALLDFARGANATQLVLGTSRRSRLARLFNPGIGAAVVQDSGSIDGAHGHPPAGRRPCLALAARAYRGALPMKPAGGGVGAGGRAALAGHRGRRVLRVAVQVVHRRGAVLSWPPCWSRWSALGPALLAALLSGLLLNYFLTPRPAVHLHHRPSGERGSPWRGDGWWSPSRWRLGRGPGRRRRAEQAAPGAHRGRAARLVRPHGVD